MPTWKRVSRERYWDMLEVLPPAVFGGGAFMVGEPANHDPETGQPTFAAFKQTGDAYFEATEPMTIAAFRKICPGVGACAWNLDGSET